MARNAPKLAIVGMACKLPKGLEDTKSLWNAMLSRVNTADVVPKDRWTADRYYSSNAVSKGKAYIRRGNFLTHDISTFDAAFFGISPRDVENMDPQQRILLEVVWEAFENAGLNLPAHAGRQVGVYVGGFMLDHMISQMTPANRSQINQNTAAGMMMTMLSNRISHTFDLCGPSLSIDTACSSSLVAFHYACQDLWNGACELAVVGGSNIMLRPEYPMGMCKGHFLSRDGECKSFDARADGYGRGEGAAIVLVKTLDAALRNGDHILATVLGTGSNQDGRTPGISMPNGEAQRQLIENVCSEYGIDPRLTKYVECHGTGTAIGDPTEATAIGQSYGAARQAAGLEPVVIGSIKSNIGHLEAAAGIAAVVKAVLTLQHRVVPPLANLRDPNPAIPFQDLGLRLADQPITIAQDHEPFQVAINSFGYGGSNAHVVLGDTSSIEVATSQKTDREHEGSQSRRFPYFLPISGKSDKALGQIAANYAQSLKDDTSLEDLLYTAAFKRAHLSHRAVVQGSDRQSLIASLETLAKNETSDQIAKGTMPFQGIRQPVFVFTGMGPQWWAMGQELYREEPIYRQAVDEADAVFQSVAGFSALAEMQRSEQDSRMSDTRIAQPANFLIQIGIMAVLRAAGIEPGAVVGHSVGELASAYAAGALSLRDAMLVCFHRSQLQATCAGTGGMLAIGLSKQSAQQLIDAHQDRVSIAAVNGPTNVTIAGDSDVLRELAEQLNAQGVFHRLLDVEVPYHSPMMDPILDSLAQELATVQPQPPQLPLYSTVTGHRVEGPSYGADYWPLNVRQSVEFAAAIQALLDDGYNTFLEVGPHPVLATSLKDCIKVAGKECRTLFTLRRNQPERRNLHQAIMSVFAEGCDIDWSQLIAPANLVMLPNYPWQREKYWLENDRGIQDRIASIEYPILGIQEAPGTPAWRNDFDHEPMNYLRDHVVTGMPVLPAAAYIEAMMELAAVQFPMASCLVARDFSIQAPMLILADRGLDSVTSFEPSTRLAIIRSLENGRLGPGQIHCTSKLAGFEQCQATTQDIEDLKARFTESMEIPQFYRGLDHMGLSYGPAFQTVRQLYMNDSHDQVLARIEVQPSLQDERYHIHPTLLDASFQTLSAMLGNSDSTYLPTGIAEVCLHTLRVPNQVWSHGVKTLQTPRFIDCDITLFDDAGNVVATIRGMRSTAAAKRERVDQFGDKVKRQILAYEWQYGENLSEPKRLGSWLVLGDAQGAAGQIADRLEYYGAFLGAKVSYGDAYLQDGNVYQVRSLKAEDLQNVLSTCGELDGVVLAHGLDEDPSDPVGETAVSNTLLTAQALLAAAWERPPRVYVVTKAAFTVQPHDDPVQPRQAAINGFVRVAWNEIDGSQWSSVDLPNQYEPTDIDALTLELLCDDAHDEVALRGGLRLVSELTDSQILSQDRIAYGRLDDDHPILVRPLLPQSDSIGTARILATQRRSPSSREVRVRVDSVVVPPNLLLDPSTDFVEQPTVVFQGTVLEHGRDVKDLMPLARIAGYAPSDLGSQMVVDRSSIVAVPIPENVLSSMLVSLLDRLARAEFVLAHLKQHASRSESETRPQNRRALIEFSPMGMLLAETSLRHGFSVALLVRESQEVPDHLRTSCSIYTNCPIGLASAIEEVTLGQGFDVLMANMQSWVQRFDFHAVTSGGSLVDLDDPCQAILLPPHVESLLRTDLQSFLAKSTQAIEAMTRAVQQITDGQVKPVPCFEVSVADIAWQKLPIANANATLVITFDAGTKELPMVVEELASFDPEASYLITGGFGGFGQKTADWLVAQGARHLILTGRTGADTPERQAIVDALEKAGANVMAAACDTSDFSSLQRLLTTISEEMPPLKGIFHSGAIIKDQPIAEIDLDTLRSVMRSKALGAWNLHLLTRDLSLDHFVLYSSVANLVGNSRQAIYSAANGFLNGLAHFRQSQGLPAMSVNWGAIADVGVVAQDEKLEQFLRYTGLRGIQSWEGLEVMRIGLARRVPQFGVSLITSWADWARFETRGAKSRRFASLIAADSVAKDNSLREALVAELQQLDPADQVEMLALLMREIMATVLKADPESIAIDRTIDQLGVDSLMATEIQSRLDTNLGVSISILELLGDATLRSVASKALKGLVNSTNDSAS